jgi:aromatic-L-amino-acid decarboxylase
MLDGKEFIDSIVFNPHKWMFTGFDCSAYFVKNPAYLIRTFEILPEYLRTRTRGEVNDYRDWGIPLGRRFRALKLWSVMRMYGVEGLRDKVRGHIRVAKRLAELIIREDDFQILAPVTLNVVCFRYRPAGKDDDEINRINETLNHRLNDTGKIYLTHTTVNGIYTLRMVIGQTNVTPKHVEKAWKLIMKTAREL